MARIPKTEYSFDFETTTGGDKTRVWLWGAVSLETEVFTYGTDIDSFMEFISRRDCKGYFHNLKFDIQFMLYWLFKNGYTHTFNKDLLPGRFNTLITDRGVFYSIKIRFMNGVTAIIWDSLKVLPFSVDESAKAFGLEISKKKMDYDLVKYDDITHMPTNEELEYLRNDCLIVAEALMHLKDMGLNKMTTASNALSDFKKIISSKEYDYRYEPLTIEEDSDCRKAYKGGWTYLNPEYIDKMIGNGRVYDVNSMYPWAMKYCELPLGKPIFFKGKYKKDNVYRLYIQCIRAEFKLREGKLPTIQIKGSLIFRETEYLTESKEPVILYLTSVDLKLFLECYDARVEYICGYKFRSKKGQFSEYVDKWYGLKSKATIKKNMALRTIAKLMQNGLYGKFGSNPNRRQKYPYFDSETNIIKYALAIPEVSNDGYVPLAAFITSYCRDKIIRSAIICGNRFIYADTDSLHILGDEEPPIEIDNLKLGAFKLESTFVKAKYHRAKCYIEESEDGELDKKCAGLPRSARELFNFDTMKVGSVFEGKLVPKNVEGGVILVERDFTIK